jgi:hypothetical protein
MPSKATTVTAYLAELPEDRRAAIDAVRRVILKNLDKDYEEHMSYGMIGYCVPHRVYPAGYHCNPKQPLPFAGLASQKGHMSLYLMGLYGSAELVRWFESAWAKTGKKLDMGKSCVRFKKLDDLPLDVIGAAFARLPAKVYIEHYEKAIKGSGRTSTATKKDSPAGTKNTKPAKKTAKKVTKTTAKKATKAATSARGTTSKSAKSAKATRSKASGASR